MIEYQSLSPPYDEVFSGALQRLCQRVFDEYGPFDFEDVSWALRSMPDVSAQAAVVDGELVGFKIGYASTPRRYYSFLGGVHEEYRRQGAAREMAERQHTWARERGYTGIETGAINSKTAMIALNLSMGFRPIGNYCRTDIPRITMYKDL